MGYDYAIFERLLASLEPTVAEQLKAELSKIDISCEKSAQEGFFQALVAAYKRQRTLKSPRRTEVPQ